jgi:hypothetical protein
MNQYLRDAIFWVAAACCLVGTLAVLRATIAATRAADGAATRARRVVEIAYAVLPAIALVAVLAATWLHVQTSAVATTVAPAGAIFVPATP